MKAKIIRTHFSTKNVAPNLLKLNRKMNIPVRTVSSEVYALFKTNFGRCHETKNEEETKNRHEEMLVSAEAPKAS